MILPPFFGSSTKSQDNSWEALRSTFFGLDALTFPLPDKFIYATFFGMDELTFKLQ